MWSCEDHPMKWRWWQAQQFTRRAGYGAEWGEGPDHPPVGTKSCACAVPQRDACSAGNKKHTGINASMQTTTNTRVSKASYSYSLVLFSLMMWWSIEVYTIRLFVRCIRICACLFDGEKSLGLNWKLCWVVTSSQAETARFCDLFVVSKFAVGQAVWIVWMIQSILIKSAQTMKAGYFYMF